MTSTIPTSQHPVVSREEWLAARTAHLTKEKEFTKLRDDLARERRELPWEKVEKDYTFDTPEGKKTLAQLFGKQNQLIVYHFMFPPEKEEGCKHCSFWADNFDRLPIHLNHRDISFVAVSRAPLKKIEAFRKRMGWTFRWVSSEKSDFNYDFQASYTPEELQKGTASYNFGTMKPGFTDREGVSVFVKDPHGAIFHTYSTYARGIDMLNTAYHYIDLTPKGRDEGTTPQSWLRFHDRYED